MFFRKLREEWDAICLGCGKCCCEKIPFKYIENRPRRVPGVKAVNKRYFIDYSSPCSYLDIETGNCLVYEKRFRVCRSCLPMTIFHALFADYLPEDCAYVQKFRFWRK
ncbi:MAG: YkgJ family cysteine cluster protein [Spirochaetales bacterium]|uniref:YkgJ family cysteine cluster protein n=1 Tax=Candidatus Thalassospirochaeta sargassi TaxID=3119039 RepID=A0AAJ1ICM4_9SPIO|nr:YkgJ family cysteine cluster protein [Spirochaetales bacterium]